MKKRYLLLILVLALSMVATACSGTKDDATEKEKIMYTGEELDRAPAFGNKDTIVVVDDKIQPYLDEVAEMKEWDVEPYLDELKEEGKITEQELENIIMAYYYNIPEGQ